MRRILITLMLCIIAIYLGIVLMISWIEYTYVVYENDFTEAFHMMVYGSWFVLGMGLLFLPMFTIIFRHGDQK